MVGIRFQTPTDVDEFLTKKEYWCTWFKYFKAGNNVSGTFGRIAWLKIVGLLLELWSEENFSRIASEFKSNQDVNGGDENSYNMDENMLEDGDIKDKSDDDDVGISETIFPNEPRRKTDVAGTGGEPTTLVVLCAMTNDGDSG
ncbi:unnamed protein product [Lactuca saligna]|uniref:DUF4283 domain-containing protein n=1 Tax=Lactuca saligna TaxID=75948 RepID=A0AA35ZF51_LACSI|nr:unnamed protein product [Lactuca saligna]